MERLEARESAVASSGGDGAQWARERTALNAKLRDQEEELDEMAAERDRLNAAVTRYSWNCKPPCGRARICKMLMDGDKSVQNRMQMTRSIYARFQVSQISFMISSLSSAKKNVLLCLLSFASERLHFYLNGFYLQLMNFCNFKDVIFYDNV